MTEPKMAVDKDGTKHWHLNGNPHREDGPAVERVDGEKHWYLNGKRHREDGPAIEYADGEKHWFLNDKRHREDGPAIECTDGTKGWYLNGNMFQSEEEFFRTIFFDVNRQTGRYQPNRMGKHLKNIKVFLMRKE